MKVLIVTTSFPQPSNPNSGYFIQQLVNILSDNLDITVVTPADSSKARTIKKDKFVQVNFAYAPASWRTLAHSPGGLAELKTRKYALLLIPVILVVEFFTVLKLALSHDLIHANWSINGVISCVAGKIARKPVVVTLRGSDVNKAKNSRVFKFSLWFCLKMGAGTATVSRTLLHDIRLLFPWYSRNISVIENGVEQDFFKIERNRFCNREPLRILVIGNLTKNKSVDILLKGIAKSGTNGLVIDIVGDGPEKKNLERLAEDLGLARISNFHGVIEASRRLLFFRNADIFLFASKSEGRPNVVLEAMASALPIVVRDMEAVSELIENEVNGLVFNSDDETEIAKRIKSLVNSPELRIRLGEKARNGLIERQLTWEKAAEKYITLYKYICNSEKVV